MGFFGETSEERLLRERLAEAAAENQTLREGNIAAGNVNVELERRLERARTVGRIADNASRFLEKAEKSGEVQISAESTATEVLKKRAFDQASAIITNQLLDERGRAIAATHAAEWLEEQREELDKTLEQNGTYRNLEKEATQNAKLALIEELLAAKKAEITASLDTPDEKERVQAEIVAESDTKLAEFRDQERERLKTAWRDEAIVAAHDAIRVEVEAGKDKFIANVVATYAGGKKGLGFREKIRAELEGRWTTDAEFQVQQQITDEELLALQQQKLEREKRLLKQENYEVLFSTSGIDLKIIPAGVSIELQFGFAENVIKEETYKERDSWGDVRKKTRRVPVRRLVCGRKLEVVALGEGRFRVEADSMTDSISPIEQAAAIASGSIIHFGREITEAKTKRFEESMREGAIVLYDDDTSDEHVMSLYHPVANLIIDGISVIQGIDELKMITTSK